MLFQFVGFIFASYSIYNYKEYRKRDRKLYDRIWFLCTSLIRFYKLILIKEKIKLNYFAEDNISEKNI